MEVCINNTHDAKKSSITKGRTKEQFHKPKKEKKMAKKIVKKTAKKTTKKTTAKVASKKTAKKTTKPIEEDKILVINGNSHKIKDLEMFAQILSEYKTAMGGEGVKNFSIFNVSQAKTVTSESTWKDLHNGDVITISKYDPGAQFPVIK